MAGGEDAGRRAPSSLRGEKGIRRDAGQTCFSTMLFLKEFGIASQNKGPGLRQLLAHPGIILTQRGNGEIVIKICGN